jgi:hypothetical protein
MLPMRRKRPEAVEDIDHGGGEDASIDELHAAALTPANVPPMARRASSIVKAGREGVLSIIPPTYNKVASD